MSILNTGHDMGNAASGQLASSVPDEEIVLVFKSNTMVLDVEDLLEELELDFELIPVPKEVNPNCGLAISFNDKDRPKIMRALNRAGFRPSAAYVRRGGYFSPWGDRPYPSAAS